MRETQSAEEHESSEKGHEVAAAPLCWKRMVKCEAAKRRRGEGGTTSVFPRRLKVVKFVKIAVVSFVGDGQNHGEDDEDDIDDSDVGSFEELLWIAQQSGQVALCPICISIDERPAAREADQYEGDRRLGETLEDLGAEIEKVDSHAIVLVSPQVNQLAAYGLHLEHVRSRKEPYNHVNLSRFVVLLFREV